jgi:transcriptional regulator with XRE-family HTH domain
MHVLCYSQDMANRMQVVSPYLEAFWNPVLAQKGWNAKQLAEASAVSYGYVRKIVNGTLIPSRDAIRRICLATGQDFVTVWSSLVREQQHETAPEELAEIGEAPVSAPETEDAHCATRRKINSIMDGLPIEGMFELLRLAWTMEDKYNDGQNRSRELYTQRDEDGRLFRWENLRVSEDTATLWPEVTYAVLGVEGHWRYPKEKMEQLIENGRVAIPPGGKEPRLKSYLNSNRLAG